MVQHQRNNLLLYRCGDPRSCVNASAKRQSGIGLMHERDFAPNGPPCPACAHARRPMYSLQLRYVHR
eukprot:6864619-Alexandrium_andersonii.AAC.1